MRELILQVADSSTLGQVIGKVLCAGGIRVADSAQSSQDVVILNLENLKYGQNIDLSCGSAHFIGLSFSTGSKARLSPPPFFTPSAHVCYLQLPVLLADLYGAIRRMPDGFVRVYRHPGVNLYFLLKEIRNSRLPEEQLPLLLSKLADLDPEVYEKTKPDLEDGMDTIPLHVLFSFYSRIAHQGGNRGLMGALARLAGRAYDFYKFGHNPRLTEQAGNGFRNAANSFVNAAEKKEFLSATDDIESLLGLMKGEPREALVREFLDQHTEIAKILLIVEASAGKALNLESLGLLEIRDSAEEAARELDALLLRVKAIKEELER